MHINDMGKLQSRVVRTAQQLLDLLAQFPMVNPSQSDAADLDIVKLFNQIRSKYKMLCALAGARSYLRTDAAKSETLAVRASSTDDPDSESSSISKKQPVWRIDNVHDSLEASTDF